MTPRSLEEQAQRFAEDLSTTVRALVPTCAPFKARVMTGPGGQEGFIVSQDPETGIPLLVEGVALLNLTVKYRCSLDRSSHYLAVDSSEVKVYAAAQANREPLFRYEYDRDAAADMPAARIQVHAHRDAVAFVMSHAGEGTRRGKRRARSNHVPEFSELHFPVGGHRFRPCLEDVLEMLVNELGVDSTPEGRDSLRVGREAWRRKQIRSVVRDAPREAIATLETLGYSVILKEGAPTPVENLGRLRDF